MSSATTTDNREQLVEEYVHITAYETLLSGLASRIYDAAGLKVPWDVTVYGDVSPNEHTFSRLWPHDEDLGTPEHQLAAIRSNLLASQLAFTLAGASEELLDEGRRLAALADRDARHLTLAKTEEA